MSWSLGRPRGRLTAVLVATLITLIAVVPLAWIAWDARDDGPASADGLSVIVDGEARGLGGLAFDAGATDRLVVDDAELATVSWALYRVDDEALVSEGRSSGGAPFVLDTEPGSLDPGLYDLLVSATTRDGETVRRAARFQIGDGS